MQPAVVIPALTLIVPELQFVHAPPAVEYLPAAHAPPQAGLLKGAPVVPSLPAGHEGAVTVPTPGGQYLPGKQLVPVGVVTPSTHVFPALHGFDVAVVLPVAVQ